MKLLNFLSAAVLAACAVSLMTAQPAMALVPAAATTAEPAAPAAVIDNQQDNGEDDRITSRLKAIFAEIPELAGVNVTVTEGVVTLSGTVPSEKDISRATEIVSRVDGVVTLESDLERDISVGENLENLGGLKDRFAKFMALLPLIGVALLVALVIALIGYLIAGLTGLWRKIMPNSFLAELIATAIRAVFVIGGIVIALDIIGATALLGAVLGGAGVIGLALGFAMRDTVENYVASLMLSLRQPFRANDHVLIDDLEGRIIRLTSRATVMMTLDGNHLRIPNSTVFKAVILNYTTNPQRRFEFELGVDADDDPRAARKLGIETLAGLPFISSDPAPEARIEQVGDSNIVVRFLGWIDQRETDFFKARSKSIPAVKDALECAGFALPEPIYRLRFDAGTPLPFENVESGTIRENAKTEAAKLKRKPVQDETIDVTAKDEIAQMVEAERSSGPDADDLLDHSRPVE
ncbi:mechanosensitive ion channel domain-containing protein [Altererythrobacter aquiaggeris]|uniref:mechanosensitive ion channel domain-containing protein n=1 Tax=Aestuarierythrobacter aquiaggeris TaxID=1898396 RepID=UPI00301624D4